MILNIIGGIIILLAGILIGYHVGLHLFAKKFNCILEEYDATIQGLTEEYEDMANLISQQQTRPGNRGE